MLEAVLFDKDGVLVDSERGYFLGVRAAFRLFGVELSEEEFIRRWMLEQTETAGLIRDMHLEEWEKEIRAVKRSFVDRNMKHVKRINDAKELVEGLCSSYALGLVSSSNRWEIDTSIGRLYRIGMFKVIVSANDVKRKKPDPEPYIKAVSLLQLNPENVVVIEDNPSGVISAKKAGCKVIAYPNGFTIPGKYPDIKMDFSSADVIVRRLRDVHTLIKRFS